MKLDDKPTAESIAALRVHLTDIWRNTWDDWAKRDSYYFQEFALWPEQMTGRPTFHPGRSRQIVDAAVDHQMAFDPKVHRFPAGKGDEHELRADTVEQYLTAVLQEAALLESVLTWKAAPKNLIHLGYAVIEGPKLDYTDRPRKPSMRPAESGEDYEDRLVHWENRKKTWMPFRIGAPNPASVLLDPEQKQPRFAIKHALWYSHDLYSITSQRKGKRKQVTVWETGDNPFELIMCDEFWTTDWHALVANTGESYGRTSTRRNGDRGGDSGEPLLVERNTWGFVPYAHAFCGWGQAPTQADKRDPMYLAAGILTPAMETLKLQAQAVAGRHNALIDATFHTMATRGDPAEFEAQRARGDTVQMGDKSDAWILETPQLPQWLFEIEQWYDKDIELATMSRSLTGIRQQGVSAVGTTAILDTAAARKFVAANKQMDHLATTVATNILRLVDLLGETLYCRGKTIKPSDIEHDYSVQVEFKLVDPVLQLQRQELGMAQVREGLKSIETFWSADAGLEDATGERKRILQDSVRANPIVHEYLAALAAEEMGLGDLLRQQQAAGTDSNGTNPPNAPVIYGPDGLPILGGSMGRPKIEGAGQAESPLRQALTPNVAKPGRVNASAFMNRRT